MTGTKDLFEMLKDLCGCGYISDLRYEPYLTTARSHMQTICLKPFSLFQLSDMAEYLYEHKPSFADRQEAADFFKSKRRGRKCN